MRAIRLLTAAVAALTAAVLLTSCNEHKKKNVSSATIVCDESFQNIMKQEIDVFEYVYPKTSFSATMCRRQSPSTRC